jgi:hypothetical protein
MVLINIDFWGTDEELKIFENALTNAVTKTQGAEYLGRFGPESQKWHYTYFCKADSLTVWDSVLKNLDYKRDKKLMSHETVEFARARIQYNPPFLLEIQKGDSR